MVKTTVPVITGRKQQADLPDEESHQDRHHAAHQHGAGDGAEPPPPAAMACMLGT